VAAVRLLLVMALREVVAAEVAAAVHRHRSCSTA
jgi:hypothetical protein